MQSIHIMMVIILTIMIGWCPEGRAENKSPKINVQDIIKPDGSLDLKKIGQINISGSLNASDYLFVIDRDTKEPIFLPGTSASHPDDVYWDNTASPCLGGIDGTVNAMMVVPFKNVIRLALLALTFLILYHIFHAISFLTHTSISAEVAPCACLGKPRAQASTQCLATKC